MSTLKVAVVGSGPAGCYAADRVMRKATGPVAVDVFDRLPTPFGLVRSGVAPDHQSIKNVARVMAKALAKPECRFLGNVEIGRDLSLDDLRAAYDAVILAIGAPEDRSLGIPGEDLPGVVGSGAFTRWYNDHPDGASRAPELGAVENAVVIGNGNVAVDVTRMLAKQGAAMDQSDLSPEVESHLGAAPLRRITVAGRRGAGYVKFTPAEIRELGHLAGVAPRIDPADLAEGPADPDNAKPFDALKELAEAPAEEARREIAFLFNAAPEAILETEAGHVGAVRFRHTQVVDGRAEPTDETVDVPADLVVPCIGYTTRIVGGLDATGGRLANEEGLVAPGLYVVGWAKRGPSGTIGTNRSESQAIGDRILAEVTPGDRPGGAAIDEKLAAAGVHPVDWQGWERIDAAETARARDGRVRHKLVDVDAMLAVAREEAGDTGTGRSSGGAEG